MPVAKPENPLVPGFDILVDRSPLPVEAAPYVVDITVDDDVSVPSMFSLTLGGADVYGSVVPFAIQWNEGGHPSDSAPKGCHLVALHGEHPEPDHAQEALAALGVELEVTIAPAPALVLTFDSPNGPVELR